MDAINRPRPLLELWAGVECSVCRIGDRYYDQLEESGHATRPQDLHRIAGLGVRTVRYPVLWERVAPDGLDRADWSWPDARLEHLRRLGLRPVVGLVHHGGGPRHTGLLEPTFAEGLAAFARAVARRYPWVDTYTPVNEPLTTARFAGLYGHWHPHGRDPLTFGRAFLNECKAVVLAMRAVREVNPTAQLVQTEDLGKTFSTPTLAYQADFENERRWLTWDLLCGRVDRHHMLWDYFRWAGLGERELAWFLDNPCLPDILGVNHYITSERFLDERVERYPGWSLGSNGRHTYADIEAVRVCAGGPVGPVALLGEVWDRYRLPVAVTEAHLACTREDQLRWFTEVWDAALLQRTRGANVCAVTAWSLFGAFDWNSLMTRRAMHYEPGAFDLRATPPRSTALVGLLRELASGQRPSHPVLTGPGWWRRLDRLLYPAASPHPIAFGLAEPKAAARHLAAQPLLITGATGTLGRAFARLCKHRGLAYRLLRRTELDIAEPCSVEAALARYQPWAVVNAAGYVRVDDAEREPYRCYRENADGPAALAAACAARGIGLLTFSSDLVFDGRCHQPYREAQAPAPLNVYGHSKADAERRVLEVYPQALVVRTSAFFGPWDSGNFVALALRALAHGERFVAADDTIVSPTYVPDLVHACLDLMIDREHGLWHLANGGAVSWHDLARTAAATVGVDAGSLVGVPTRALGLPARRPRYSVLATDRGLPLQPLDDALACFCRDCEIDWHQALVESAVPPSPVLMDGGPSCLDVAR